MSMTVLMKIQEARFDRNGLILIQEMTLCRNQETMRPMAVVDCHQTYIGLLKKI